MGFYPKAVTTWADFSAKGPSDPLLNCSLYWIRVPIKNNPPQTKQNKPKEECGLLKPFPTPPPYGLWRIRMERSGEKRFFLCNMLFPFASFGCHRNDLSLEGEEFFQSRFSRSAQHSTAFSLPSLNIWPLPCRGRVRGSLRKRKIVLAPHLGTCAVSTLGLASVSPVFIAFPSPPPCVQQMLQCWLNLATGVTVPVPVSTSITFTSCWGVKLSYGSLPVCAGRANIKMKSTGSLPQRFS